MTIPRRTGLLFALLALSLLAACAPVVSGSSSRSAVELGTSPIEAVPGQTLYLARTLQLSDVGMSADQLGAVLFVPETSSRSSARAPGIGLVQTRVPAFWDVDLESARFVERYYLNRTDTTLEVIMKVSIPADAQLGQQVLRVRVESRRNGTEITIPLRIRQSLS